jgi:hypothetical protein
MERTEAIRDRIKYSKRPNAFCSKRGYNANKLCKVIANKQSIIQSVFVTKLSSGWQHKCSLSSCIKNFDSVVLQIVN